MAKKARQNTKNGTANHRKEKPRSITIARGGIFQLLNLITATMGDVLSGSVTRAVLKLLELQVNMAEYRRTNSEALRAYSDLHH